MCGIAGIISSNTSLVTAQRLSSMSDALAHRGPDGSDHWIDDSSMAGLAHRRLAIIDLSPQAAQPMHYSDRYTIVYNGELYNYPELKKDLQQAGYSFRTQSDTEVILAAYAHHKAACLSLFDGMFAFAIWDKQEQQLFAARDRFGEKPFYYCLTDGALVFASEMKALWAVDVQKSMDPEMLYNYITLGYVQDPYNPAASFYQDIYKLPARHYLYYDPREHRLTQEVYWELDAAATDKEISPEQAVERFGELFTGSVQRRLRSDVPVGTSLSGGLDSSSVLATIHAINNGADLKTFSATYPGFKKDESAFIGSVTNYYKTPNYQVKPDTISLLRDFEKLCYHQEVPFESSSIFAQYCVYALAKEQGVTVLLDGQGADEILAGYTHYYPRYWQELYRTDKNLLKQELAAARSNGVTAGWDWKNKMAARFPSFAASFLTRSRVKKQRQQPDLNRDFVSSYGVSHYATPHVDLLNGQLYYNTALNGLETLLQYADRNSMASGRELRLPFLNHELVEFVFSLPAAYKIKAGYTKWVLRQSMATKLPEEIVWRKDKIGFETPQAGWMQDPTLQEYIMMAKEKLVKAGVLQTRALTKKIQPQETHAADNYDWRYLVAGTLFR